MAAVILFLLQKHCEQLELVSWPHVGHSWSLVLSNYLYMSIKLT